MYGHETTRYKDLNVRVRNMSTRRCFVIYSSRKSENKKERSREREKCELLVYISMACSLYDIKIHVYTCSFHGRQRPSFVIHGCHNLHSHYRCNLASKVGRKNTSRW